MKKPTYTIGDFVYHVLPESPKGIVIDARYVLSIQSWEYFVTFYANSESKWYSEVELSPNISFT